MQDVFGSRLMIFRTLNLSNHYFGRRQSRRDLGSRINGPSANSNKGQSAGTSANNERNIMEYATKELERIADALEEILRLVKKDMEPKKK